MTTQTAIDATLGSLELPLTLALKERRTKDNIKKLSTLLLPFWDFCVRCSLGRSGVVEERSSHDDMFNDVYIMCLKTLSDLKSDATFKWVKCYYSKTIAGFVKNTLFRNYKKRIQYVQASDAVVMDEIYRIYMGRSYTHAMNDSDTVFESLPDPRNDVEVIEGDTDIKIVSDFIKEEVCVFREYHQFLFREMHMRIYSVKEETYKKAVYARYLRDGSLLRAIDYLRARYGNVFLRSGEIV